MKLKVRFLTLLLIVLAGRGGAAQGSFALPQPRRVEIGLSRLLIKRTIRHSDGVRQDADWGRGALFLRVALTKALLVEVDGTAWHRGATSRFPNRDYFDYAFGVGFTVLPLQRGMSFVGLGIRYHEQTNLDQSLERYSKRSRHIALAAMAARRLLAAPGTIDIWGGPAYQVDWLWHYPPFDPVQRGKSVNNIVAQFGASLLVKSRLRVFGQLTYTPRWQSEWGASVTF